jgi:UDP-sulfoquinovose synthase
VLGRPLSVYGAGTQTRAVIDIRDTVECIRLACENPAEQGEFRVFNQATESFSLAEMAKIVANSYPGQVDVEYVDNPRVEQENHYYAFTHTALESLGLEPHLLSDTLLTSMFGIIEQHRDRVDLDALRPTVRWREAISSRSS